jgi:hypothetical protein
MSGNLIILPETIGCVRRYWDEGHIPSFQGSLPIFLATADAGAFLLISVA